jgi:hypothetical protein
LERRTARGSIYHPPGSKASLGARNVPSVPHRGEPRQRIATIDAVVHPKPVEKRNHSFLPFYYFRHYLDAGAFTDVPGFAVDGDSRGFDYINPQKGGSWSDFRTDGGRQ